MLSSVRYPSLKGTPSITSARCFKASNSEPALLSTLDQLEHQRQDGVLGDTASGLVGSEAYGSKGRFNRVGGANMRPMLSGEVEEGQQDIPVFG